VVDLELQGKIAAVVDYYQIHEMIDLIVTEEELFEVSEVPEFVNTKDYWTWRCAFRRFTTAHSVKDSDVSRALNRVLLRFSSLQVQGPRRNPRRCVPNGKWNELDAGMGKTARGN
jgi:hypothetical protein